MSGLKLSRRQALTAGVGLIAFPAVPGSGLAQPRIGRAAPREFNLAIEHVTHNITGRRRPAMAINGQVPAPLLRFREGEEVVINVANRLREDTSIHWHGLILPSGQDGVPGISDGFQGIPAGQTHQYRFPLVQSGTYWYHSHSGTQEQSGLYGPLIIDPARPAPYSYDRDYVLVLSDWIDENPVRVIENLKRDPGYYNYSKRTLTSLVRELSRAPDGAARSAIVRDRMMWADMRMDPTDIEDVTGYTFLVNGRPPQENFTAVYRPGETVRLRFINAGAMSHFDLRIPGLEMTVVHVHGNDVRPVTVDEMRIAPAETFDVLVRPTGGQQFQILGESMGRQGFASASLATQEGLPMLPLPPHRERPLLTMADMGGPYGPTGLDRGTARPEVDRPGQVAPMSMGSMGGMDHSAMAGSGSSVAAGDMSAAGMDHSNMAGMDHSRGGGSMAGMDHSTMAGMDHSAMQGTAATSQPGRAQRAATRPSTGGRRPAQAPSAQVPQQAAMDHAAMGHGPAGTGQAARTNTSAAGAHAGHGAMGQSDPFAVNTGAPPGTRVLTYRDLRALANPYPVRAPDRIIEVRLTGNMERYMWSINGNRFSEAQPMVWRLGERVRLRFINETMMSHPMHLHGVWMQPQVGNGAENPLLHTVSIRPGSTMDVDVEADAEGGWAFHCHMLFHMETGMMRKVEIRRPQQAVSAR
nr:copper resistance system multicopper oxidase [uncultured Roseococcus sp.]